MEIPPKIFREYDIRGVAGEDLDPTTVETLGRAVGTYLVERGLERVVVCRDCRLSSPELFQALSAGLLATGCGVTDIGVLPTPLLYFTVYYKGYDGGVMITGSHNPPQYNGFKIMAGRETLYGPEIQELRKIAASGRFREGRGELVSYDILPEYLDYVAGNIKLGRRLKVVIDAGNGTAGAVAGPLFRRLGCDVECLYCDMDGRFPNHHPDPTLPEALQPLIRRVLESGADVGLGYDGDADRLGVIDEKGGIIWGDQLMIIFARAILPSMPGAAVISEVKASQLLYDEVERLGGRPVMWKTGHSLIKKKIKEEKAPLAGEMSGHIFFADRWFGFDDGIYASARLVEILSKTDKKLSEELAGLPRTFVTPEIRVYASDEVKFKIVDEVKAKLAGRYRIIDIDGVRAVFPHGWGLVRASNTQPVIVLRFEADSEEALAAIQAEVKGLAEEAIRRLTNGSGSAPGTGQGG
jgi:phosphomannomutase/phosphoglucomutase